MEAQKKIREATESVDNYAKAKEIDRKSVV